MLENDIWKSLPQYHQKINVLHASSDIPTLENYLILLHQKNTNAKTWHKQQ